MLFILEIERLYFKSIWFLSFQTKFLETGYKKTGELLLNIRLEKVYYY